MTVQFASTDELDLFGLFLTSGLYFRDDGGQGRATMMMIGNHDEAIKAYYYGLGRRERPAKPLYPLPGRIEKMIATLEKFRPANFAAAVLDILAYGSGSYELLDRIIPKCERALGKGKPALAGIANTEHADAGCVLFGCAAPGSTQERELIDRAKVRKVEAKVGRASLIVWQPPLTSGRMAVHAL